MVGAHQFAASSIRAGEAKGYLDIFGGMGAVLCSDFAQLRPIGQKTLLAPLSAGGSRISAKISNDGRRIFDTFSGCVRLRVIYRQGDPRPFKDSTRRMRDSAMTIADYDIWKSSDIADADCPGELQIRADSPLWICEEDASPGERGGGELPTARKQGGRRSFVARLYAILLLAEITRLGNSGASGLSVTWRLGHPFCSLLIRSKA